MKIRLLQLLAIAVLVATAATYATEMAGVGTDTTTAIDWRNPKVKKDAAFDPNGDGIYGTDGYYVQIVGKTAKGDTLELIPAYVGKVTPAEGVTMGQSVHYKGINHLDLAWNPTVGYFQQLGAGQKNFLEFTLTKDANFVLGVLTDMYNNYDFRRSPVALTVRQTAGGSASATVPVAADDHAKYVFFQIVGKAGDSFVVAGEHDPKASSAHTYITGLTFEATTKPIPEKTTQ